MILAEKSLFCRGSFGDKITVTIAYAKGVVHKDEVIIYFITMLYFIMRTGS